MSRGRNRRSRRTNPRQTAAPPQPVGQESTAQVHLPSEIDKAIRLQIQERQVVQAHFAGPLPLPEHLLEYERVAPGAAERIIRMAELQADHRRAMESKVVDSQVRVVDSQVRWESLGQIFGFVIGMTALIGGIGLMASDKSIAGVATSFSALAALVGVFVWSKRQRNRELREKANSAAFGAEPTDTPQLPNSPSRN